MIDLQNVTKTFSLKGERKIICENLTFRFNRGRSIAMLGRNGAGKSTLMRLLAGSIQPDSGRIVHKSRVSFPLGFAGSFHGELTGAENIDFVARIYGHDTSALYEYVEDFAELGSSIHMPFKTYSSGMKARLSFGVSMGLSFDFYLVDEITAVGDKSFKRKSQAVFREKLSNADVIMISHSNASLREFCDAGIVLEHGRFRYFDDLEDAIALHEELQA